MDLYIVTGASRGLGRALVSQLAAAPDARVLGISRAGVIGEMPWRDVKADLSTTDGRNVAIAAIGDALASGPWARAVLINNAGMLEPLGIIGALDALDIDASIDVNLTAPVALMNAFIAAAPPDLRCSVINISSGSGRRPVPGSGIYCAAKAGLDMASRVAALEMETERRPVTITSLAPGIIDTDMQVVARSASAAQFPSVERFREFKSAGMLKTADEVAERILALDRQRKLPVGIADLREL